MPYSHTTFLAFRQALASRLDDTANVFWTDAELKRWTLEALRTWQAFTSFWRVRNQFTLTPNQPFYDLTVELPAELGMTLKDQDIVTDLQFALLEPATGNSWTGTEMFTLADLTGAIQRRRDQFLYETGMILTHSVINVPPQPIGRVPVIDSVIDVKRAAWIQTLPLTDTVPLWRNDEWSYNAFLSGWNLSPGVPQSYSILAPPPLTLQLSPPPLDKGQLDLLTVNAGATLDPTVGVLLGVPDNFAWLLKWGALADLLSKDGQARDPQRAGYCEQRWQQGVEIARSAASVIQAAINEQQTFTESVSDLDAFNRSWQASRGAPKATAMASWNMFGVAPVPDNVNPYSITLDVVQNAPIPVADGNFIQLGREELDAVLDYAEHISALKMGGAEFAATVPLLQRFLRVAGQYNERLKVSGDFLPATLGQTVKEDLRRPRRESDLIKKT